MVTTPTKKECLRFAENLTLLPADPAIAEIVKVYIKRQVTPKDPAGRADGDSDLLELGVLPQVEKVAAAEADPRRAVAPGVKIGPALLATAVGPQVRPIGPHR